MLPDAEVMSHHYTVTICMDAMHDSTYPCVGVEGEGRREGGGGPTHPPTCIITTTTLTRSKKQKNGWLSAARVEATVFRVERD